VNFAAGTLAIQSGTTTLADFLMPGVPATAQFAVSVDGSNNSFITEIPCFAAGARVLTVTGEGSVEKLRVGDVLPALQDGRAARIRWLGQRRRTGARPVRIAAHAFGAGRPRRALSLSPDHAVFVDGVLIPARCLVNGASIAVMEPQDVTWCHVELD